MSNTGYKAYTNLEQYYADSGAATGVTKPNNVGDPDYIAPVLNLTYCPLPSASPSMTPSISVTPSITPTVTPSITVSSTVFTTPSVTPTITVTPSTSIGFTPSVTPTITITPSITPSVTESVPVYTYYNVDRYQCVSSPSGFICSYIDSISVANNSDGLTVGRFYLDSETGYIYNIGLYATPGAYLKTKMSGSGTKNCNELCLIQSTP